MALASQSTRSDRSVNYSGRKGPPIAAILVVGGLSAVLAGYWLMTTEKSETIDPLLPASGSTLASSLPGSAVPGPSPEAGSGSSALAAALAPREEARAATQPMAEATPPAEPEPTPTNPKPTNPKDGNTQPGNTESAPTPGASPAAAPSSAPTGAPGAEPASTPPATPGGAGNGFDNTAAPARPAISDSDTPASLVAKGLAISATDPFGARTMLSRALLSGELGPADAKQASDALVKIGRQLTLTPVFNANDQTCFQYTVQSGDTLEKIVRKQKLGCEWQLVARINNIKKPTAIRVGQRLKLPKGPFSGVVSKRDYRVDICMGTGADRIVVASLPCGLGESNGTPTGRFRVRIGSKLLDPQWTHPVTGEHFASADPKNPIGEHWLGLEGLDPSNAQLAGYGIHGTIDIDSIGQDRSLGCVRLVAEDVALVWECLADGSEVEIRGN